MGFNVAPMLENMRWLLLKSRQMTKRIEKAYG